jgi:hypothetical protein
MDYYLPSYIINHIDSYLWTKFSFTIINRVKSFNVENYKQANEYISFNDEKEITAKITPDSNNTVKNYTEIVVKIIISSSGDMPLIPKLASGYKIYLNNDVIDIYLRLDDGGYFTPDDVDGIKGGVEYFFDGFVRKKPIFNDRYIFYDSHGVEVDRRTFENNMDMYRVNLVKITPELK